MISKLPAIVVGTAFSAVTIVAAPLCAAKASEVKVLSVGSLRRSFRDPIPSFQKSSGYKVKVEEGAAGEMVARIQRGEVVDVAVVTAPQMDKLAIEGKITPGRMSAFRGQVWPGRPEGRGQARHCFSRISATGAQRRQINRSHRSGRRSFQRHLCRSVARSIG
jgi:spermidine/putrescine-binding protein